MMKREEEAGSLDGLPPRITGQLRAMIRRVRRIILVRGLLTSAAVLFGCALAIMAIDAGVMIFSGLVRWALSLTAFAAVAATAWSSLARPLSRPLSLTRMARVLETRHPELQERISSALELLALGGSAGAAGSEQLIQLLAQAAEADVSSVTPRDEFTARSLKPAMRGGAVILGVFALLFAVWPRQTSLLLARSLLPGANLAALQGAGLEVEPGDALLEEGAELTIRLKVKGRARARADVHSETAAGEKDIERMQLVTDESAKDALYELTLPMVQQSFRYRVRHGTGLTRYYDVTVLPPPAVTRMVVTCQYPAYTQRGDVVLPDGKRDIVGLAGGRVKIEADFNRAAEGVIHLGDQRIPGVAGKEPGATWTLDLATNLPARWGISLRDAHGFSNQVEWAGLSVVADRAPTVALHTPKLSKLVLPSRGEISIASTITEDFGLAAHDIVVEATGTNGPVQRRYPLTLTPGGKEEWSGEDDLAIGKLDLAGAREFKFRIRVTDTLPPELGGPHTAVSREVQVRIDENAPTLEEQEREQQLADLLGMLTLAATQLGQAADGVASVQAQTGRDPLPDHVMKALAAGRDQSGAALKLVIDAVKVCSVSRFQSMASRIAQVAQDAVGPAWVSTKNIPAAAAAQRPAQATAAVEALRAAAQQVRDLIEALKELNAALAKQDKMLNLTNRERALAKQALKAMTPEEMEEWLKKQRDLLDQLKKQPTLEGSKARELVQRSLEDMKQARDEKAPPTTDQKDQKKETENPKGKDSKGSGGKGGKQNPGDDKKQHKPPTSHKMSKGKGTGSAAAGGEGMTPAGSPGAPKPSSAQRSAAAQAQQAAEAMSRYIPMPGAASAAPPSKSGGSSTGGSSLMPGGAFAYVPGTFDGEAADADWAKIKGSSDAGASSEELETIPPEYRGLARRYFIELAREGAKSKGETQP